LARVSNQAIWVEYLETKTERYAPTIVNATPMMRIHFRYFQSGSSTEPAVRRKIDHPSVRGIEHELRDLVRRLARDE
jgi:hypothetical protein